MFEIIAAVNRRLSPDFVICGALKLCNKIIRKVHSADMQINADSECKVAESSTWINMVKVLRRAFRI